jgi:PAS domain S-box-containing protein
MKARLELEEDAVLVYDAELDTARSNPAAIEWLGFDPAGLSRTEIERRLALEPPITREEGPLSRALRGESVSGLRLVLQRGDVRRELTASCTPLYVAGQVQGAVMVWRAPGARVQEALRASEDKFSRVFHGSIAAMTITRLRDGLYLEVNDRFLQINHRTRADVIGKTTLDMKAWKHPEDRGAFVRMLERSGQVRDVEYTFTRPSGEDWTALISAEVTEIEGERVIVTSLADITEQKCAARRIQEALQSAQKTNADLQRLQQELAEREKRYRTLFETSPAGIAVIEPDGSIAEFNERAHRQLGYDREEFTRLHLRDIERIETPPEIEKHIERILQTGADRFETQQCTKTGEIRDVLVDVRTIEVRGEKRILTVSRDVTERKRAEQALWDADRNKNQFIAVLSHELRNPLGPIRNSLYILDHAVPGGEQAVRARGVIQRQVGYMARLIDDLLDVTRVSRGKIHLEREDLDLREVVRRTIEDFRPGFETVDLQLEVAIWPEHLSVYGDRTRLAQIVGNLLHNASKFTTRGGRVAISVEKDRLRNEAVIRVQDDGVGISAEMLPRLFAPFAQADSTLDRSRGGLGLGLALVKGLVELHGGTVVARSDGAGRGAEFTVRVPLSENSKNEGGTDSAHKDRLPRRVLIIEDDRDAAQSLREALELSEHRVEVAYDGEDGFECARTFRPEVVICDIGLPGMDGYDVARAFRADAALRGILLVALTGYGMPEDQARAAQAGFQHHLPKPADMARLEEILANAAPSGEAGRA